MAGKTLTAIPSAAYSATQSTQSLTPSGRAKGIFIFLNLTVRAAAETITVAIQAKDPVSGTWASLASFTATAAVGLYVKGVYPSGPGTSAAPQAGAGSPAFETINTALPSEYRILLTHSGVGAHTYSVAVQEVE